MAVLTREELGQLSRTVSDLLTDDILDDLAEQRSARHSINFSKPDLYVMLQDIEDWMVDPVGKVVETMPALMPVVTREAIFSAFTLERQNQKRRARR